MRNAAHQLAEALQQWQMLPSAATARTVRGLDTESVNGWREQIRIVALLGEVYRYLEAVEASGRNMDHYFRAFPGWSRAAFLPDILWNEGVHGNRELVPQHEIDLLYALGDTIDATGLAVQISADQKRTSGDALDELLDLLDDPALGLSEVEKQYVFELISSVRRVFDESSRLGAVDLLRRVNELLGVMTMLAETLDQHEETKGFADRIRKAARKVMPYSTFGARFSVGALGAAADLAQLTGLA